eukprot:CAMPEP_0181415154 /NCGR_PEP_ID=MMETSP1110-20121109/9869_1 /TAXON_ID=174948 /ORGANISM="Symbiodinium sp., Strain CCMP421" /LENGTH=474 /DNA_ID=CAMNT_0023538045 /DNA_START=8 /DNA_END=1432 /DNA_ORIENTATION=+
MSAREKKNAPAAVPAAPAREYLRFEVVDFHCKGLSKTVPARHRDQPVYMYAGALANGANQAVMIVPKEIAEGGCPNARLVPDWATEQLLPWACRDQAVVRRVFCDVEGLRCTPRALCGRMLAELRNFEGQGLELLAGGELEFIMAKPSAAASAASGAEDGAGRWEPLFRGLEIFTTLQGCKVMDFCYELERNMEAVGVDVLTMNTEYGEGQVEVTFAPKFGVEAADMIATCRMGTKEMAQNAGLRAVFLTKPFGGSASGGHFNFSIWAPGGARSGGADVISRVTAGKLNSFHSAEDELGLSPTARSFLAGVLAHAPAMEAVCAPTPACYTRHGMWAPALANWGMDDRLAKADKKGPPGSCYMEFRMPSSAANPYLVIAVLVASGLDGLQRELPLPPARQTEAQGAARLPGTLEEALKAFENDELLTAKLGARFVRWFLDQKRGELKFLEERLAGSARSAEEVTAAWQELYMEFL